MNLRRDALAAAAECVVGIERLCTGSADLVGTVGQLAVLPGASNVIPAQVEFSVDIRAAEDSLRSQVVTQVVEHLHQVVGRRGVELQIEQVHAENSVNCDAEVAEHISSAIESQGCRVLKIASGAGHDAAAMASITPVGMIFVRCAGGISHNPAESIQLQDADVGAQVLMQSLLNISNSAAG